MRTSVRVMESAVCPLGCCEEAGPRFKRVMTRMIGRDEYDLSLKPH